MSGWGAVTWDIARAGGFVAYGLLTLSTAIGLALTLRWQSPRWPRLINAELHNFFTLLALIFTGIHVLAVWLDPFTRFGWSEVFVPFVSHYRPLWMALGIVSLYLGLAVGLSTWVRPWIGYTWWRRLHVLTLVMFGLVTVHGLATGSDTRTWWGLGIYIGSALLVGALLWIRLLVPVNERGRAHPVIAALTALSVLVGVAWTMLGPLEPGWNAVANNGQGSGARTALAAASSASPSPSAQQSSKGQNPFARAFTAQASGTLRQSGPDASGTVTLDVQATLSGGTQGVLHIQMQGQQTGSGNGGGGISITSTSVTLGTTAGTTLYQGRITAIENGSRLRMSAVLNATSGSGNAGQIQLQMVLLLNNGQVSGTVQGTPSAT
jgi:hypothetical protein